MTTTHGTRSDPGFQQFLRAAFLASAGYDDCDLSRPLVGVVDTSSDFNTCHRQMPELVQAVRRGVLEAGGLPMVFPTVSLAEAALTTSSMVFRNLVAFETEEMILAQPMDSVVLVGGCDKTVPAQLMAALAADVPAIQVVTGPMMPGHWRGQSLGACSDCRRVWDENRAGNADHTLEEITQSLVTTAGTCMTMGTASTMAALAETMGMMLPGGATAPAPSGDRLRTATRSGRRAVTIVGDDNARPRAIVGAAAIRNAVTVLAALGGSTNAVIHLLAIARRAGVGLTLGECEQIFRRTPLLVDCKPTGTQYLTDLHNAGGIPTLLKTLEPLLDTDVLGIDGTTLASRLADTAPPQPWQQVISTLGHPVGNTGALAVISGSLAPDGAIIKTAAATPDLCQHSGPALVFESLDDVHERIDDPNLDVTENHVLVLRNSGPRANGMPETAAIPIPRKLAEQGVRDMLRISDARMVGTASGTVVVHITPETACGGPLALVRDGDTIELDLRARTLNLNVSSAELARRTAEPTTVANRSPARGWRRIFTENVLPANVGMDFAGEETCTLPTRKAP